ncbi:SMC family ATPase [Bacillus sp. DNRA2]|uniref:AAA family ATPase n=1 Tax=Bacillus sp. DNRA2 TaxID=2723053 RepID=UPI00145D9996|nr:SMC family ATPase [Bacillus sp. DNRA2]NMD69244.1 SMC family ATPase [Bacillus sp. DNRA2]
MKPIHLMMQAFGPYAGKEEIDFSLLGNRTMFVISGKTGAGKTTIFDGISYAIYGKASGEDRNGPELRSHFAQEDDPTEVALDFTLRGKRYYIWRSPQQQKKKKSGDGFTTINAKAELYEYDENGSKQLLAANVRDVDERIKELMLIDSNQFRQILMIPQGEFRKLLISDSKDKEVILQRLFHTEMYKRIEEKLKEEATELKRTVEKQIETRNQTIRGIQVLVNEELKEYLAADSVNDTLILPLLIEEINVQRTKLAEIKVETDSKQVERDNLQQSIYEAELIVKQLNTKQELLIKKTQLEGQQDHYAKIEKTVELGQKATILAKQEEICTHLKTELDEAQKAAKELQINVDKLNTLVIQHKEQLEQEKAREPERQEASDYVNRLQQMKEDVYSFAKLEATVQQLDNQLSTAKQERQINDENINKANGNFVKLQVEKSLIDEGQITYLENKRKIELLGAEIEQFQKYEVLFGRIEKSKPIVAQAKQHFENAVLRLADAKALVEELEQKWLQSQAAILASTLTEGDACPVCGSPHHPQPALHREDLVPSQEDLKAAKSQVSVLEAEKGKAESNLYQYQSGQSTLIQSLTELKAEIGENRPDFTEESFEPLKNMIQAEQADLKEKQQQLQAKINQLSSIMKQMDLTEKQKQQYSEKMKQLTELIHQLTIEHTQNRTTLERMVDQIPEELRTIQAYEAAVKAAVAKNAELQTRFEKVSQDYLKARESFATETARLETVNSQVTTTTAKLELERAAFLEKLTKQGFATYNDYEVAKKSEQELKNLSDMLRAYREELRSVTDRYHELEELLKDVKAPDLDMLTEAFADLKQQLSMLQEQYTSLFMQKRTNEEIFDKVNAINQQLKELEDRYKLIGHLHEIAKGQNTYRITFERFVLASFLDDILTQANARLTKMTSGRYQLLRKTDRSKGAGQSGLELLVFDQYTGQERHVKTLSGGESFKAALALALGLAEVVQAYAGGVSLETMFIDEGFGTLDPESLDQAIESLIDIQSSGRLVGIISHVPELKERIDARLEVFATQTGSRTEFQLMN